MATLPVPSQVPQPHMSLGVNTHPVAGLHVSFVQELPSSHAVLGVNTHPVAGLQVSVVQALLSSQISRHGIPGALSGDQIKMAAPISMVTSP